MSGRKITVGLEFCIWQLQFMGLYSFLHNTNATTESEVYGPRADGIFHLKTSTATGKRKFKIVIDNLLCKSRKNIFSISDDWEVTWTSIQGFPTLPHLPSFYQEDKKDYTSAFIAKIVDFITRQLTYFSNTLTKVWDKFLLQNTLQTKSTPQTASVVALSIKGSSLCFRKDFVEEIINALYVITT